MVLDFDGELVSCRKLRLLPTTLSLVQALPSSTMTTTTASLLLIAAYFVFLLISLKRRGKVINGPWLFLLRSFFPNWRFYHGPGDQPRLFWRVQDADGRWCDWQMFMPRAPFHILDWVYNPRNNLTLANQNLIDHLCADIAVMPENSDVRDQLTYQLTQQLTRYLISSADTVLSAPVRYQFQLSLIPAYTLPDETMVVLTSPAIEWQL